MFVLCGCFLAAVGEGFRRFAFLFCLSFIVCVLESWLVGQGFAMFLCF